MVKVHLEVAADEELASHVCGVGEGFLVCCVLSVRLFKVFLPESMAWL